MDEIRYHYAIINLKWLRIIGQILGLGVPPVHTKIYWRANGQCFMTELTNDPITPNGEIVGKGDGYTIQITKVPDLQGIVIVGDASKIDEFARLYGSTKNGDLTNTYELNDWYVSPQGYGGPYYDCCTSNTYAAWLLRKICPNPPPRPIGAIGWNAMPLFPGPAR